MGSLPRITEEAASSRKSSSSSGSVYSASGLKRGTAAGLTDNYIPPFNYEVRCGLHAYTQTP